jgi:hypothetical protein
MKSVARERLRFVQVLYSPLSVAFPLAEGFFSSEPAGVPGKVVLQVAR